MQFPGQACIGELDDSEKLDAIYGVISGGYNVTAPILKDACIWEVDDSIKLAAIYQVLNAVTGGAFSAAIFEATNLSSLPTSNPGNGQPWINGGALWVGN